MLKASLELDGSCYDPCNLGDDGAPVPCELLGGGTGLCKKAPNGDDAMLPPGGDTGGNQIGPEENIPTEENGEIGQEPTEPVENRGFCFPVTDGCSDCADHQICGPEGTELAGQCLDPCDPNSMLTVEPCREGESCQAIYAPCDAPEGAVCDQATDLWVCVPDDGPSNTACDLVTDVCPRCLDEEQWTCSYGDYSAGPMYACNGCEARNELYGTMCREGDQTPSQEVLDDTVCTQELCTEGETTVEGLGSVGCTVCTCEETGPVCVAIDCAPDHSCAMNGDEVVCECNLGSSLTEDDGCTVCSCEASDGGNLWSCDSSACDTAGTCEYGDATFEPGETHVEGLGSQGCTICTCEEDGAVCMVMDCFQDYSCQEVDGSFACLCVAGSSVTEDDGCTVCTCEASHEGNDWSCDSSACNATDTCEYGDATFEPGETHAEGLGSQGCTICTCEEEDGAVCMVMDCFQNHTCEEVDGSFACVCVAGSSVTEDDGCTVCTCESSDAGNDWSCDSSACGASDGDSNGTADGPADGSSEGSTDGTADGVPDSDSDGPSDGTVDGSSDGVADGGSDGPSDGTVDGTSDGMAALTTARWTGLPMVLRTAILTVLPTAR